MSPREEINVGTHSAGSKTRIPDNDVVFSEKKFVSRTNLFHDGSHRSRSFGISAPTMPRHPQRCPPRHRCHPKSSCRRFVSILTVAISCFFVSVIPTWLALLAPSPLSSSPATEKKPRHQRGSRRDNLKKRTVMRDVSCEVTPRHTSLVARQLDGVALHAVHLIAKVAPPVDL